MPKASPDGQTSWAFNVAWAMVSWHEHASKNANKQYTNTMLILFFSSLILPVNPWYLAWN